MLHLLSAPSLASQAEPSFEELVDAAVQAFQDRRFLESADLFGQAYELEPDPTLVYNRARALEKALETEDAIEGYEAYVKLPGTTADLRSKAMGSIAALRSELKARELLNAPDAAAPPASSVQQVAPPPGIDRTLEWVLVGTGAALLAGGGIFGYLALESQNDFDDAVQRRASLPELESLQDDVETNGLIADGLLIGGAAVAVTGLVLFLVRRPSSEASVSLQPTFIDGGGGFVLSSPW